MVGFEVYLPHPAQSLSLVHPHLAVSQSLAPMAAAGSLASQADLEVGASDDDTDGELEGGRGLDTVLGGPKWTQGNACTMA